MSAYLGLLGLEDEGIRIRRNFGDYLTSFHGAATQNARILDGSLSLRPCKVSALASNV
jgi:hypothetical protein